MKILFSTFISSFLAISLSAQVTQRVIAEHFTNTRCGNCALYNPDLIANFKNNPEVIHISYHPSSPYPTCVLNLHNKSENDGRTNYYGIYGSTPRLMINGELKTGFSNANLFTPYKGKTSPIEMTSAISSDGSTLTVEVKISTKATHSFGVEKIIVLLAEDTVFYDAPNGEKEHYNVFRKALTSVDGNDITLSNTLNSDTTITYTQSIHSEWNDGRIRVVAMLQNAGDKKMIQASQSNVVSADYKLNLSEAADGRNLETQVYPNPANEFVTITLANRNLGELKIIDLTGKVVLQQTIQSNDKISLGSISKGVYSLIVLQSNQTFHSKLVKQ